MGPCWSTPCTSRTTLQLPTHPFPPSPWDWSSESGGWRHFGQPVQLCDGHVTGHVQLDVKSLGTLSVQWYYLHGTTCTWRLAWGSQPLQGIWLRRCPWGDIAKWHGKVAALYWQWHNPQHSFSHMRANVNNSLWLLPHCYSNTYILFMHTTMSTHHLYSNLAPMVSKLAFMKIQKQLHA